MTKPLAKEEPSLATAVSKGQRRRRIFGSLRKVKLLCQMKQQSPRNGRQKEFDPISQRNPFSRQPCRRISSGKLSRVSAVSAPRCHGRSTIGERPLHGPG